MIELTAPVLIAFVDFVVKGFIILLMAFAVDGLFRRANASLRHLIWIAALIAVLMLPLASAFMPHFNIPLLTLLPADSAFDIEGIDPEALGNAAYGGPYLTPANVISIIFVVYLLGMLAVLCWQLVGRFYARRIRLQANEVRNPRLKGLLASIQKEMGSEDEIALLESEIANAPFSAGLSNPSVVLPLKAESWPQSVLRAVLTHEVAHIKRRDLLARFVAQLACCVNWFNPLAWFGLRRVMIEQEIACDNYVLGSGSKPSEYAQSLLAVANVRSGFWDYALAAIGRKEELKKRLLEILKPVRSKSPVRVGILVGLMLAAMLILMPLFLLNIWNEEPTVMAVDIKNKKESKPVPEKTKGGSGESLTAKKVVNKESGTPVEKKSKMAPEQIIKAKMEEMKKKGASKKEITKFMESAKKQFSDQKALDEAQKNEKEKLAKEAENKKKKQQQQPQR